MVLDDIRAEVDARFASGEFIPRLMQALYDHKLRFEMKHLWNVSEWPPEGDFKGADEYRLYVREKIRLVQRRRYWEETAEFHFYHGKREGDHPYDKALTILADIKMAEKKMIQKRLALREHIGEITYV